MPDVVLRGRFERDHERRYAHVPFEVPPGVRALHVSYDYSDRIASDPLLRGGNTLDIGLFDPRGIAESSPGFRGWSGSHKLSFSVTEAWATPPYLAGPISAGTWHVLLGPYKVGPHGCEYAIEINFSGEAGEPERRPNEVHAQRPALKPTAEPGWLRGDLHCHTLHSDGDSWPRDMLAHAVERGLDFLGVTDHNQVGHHADYAAVRGEHLPILLPGIEVTTYGGHWNAWGTDRWWEFREPTEEAVSRTMQSAAAAGAFVSVNHPKPHGPAWEYPNAVGYDAIEVWNGPWHELNFVSLEFWDEQLRTGEWFAAVGGSDTHELKSGRPRDRLGMPTTWVNPGNDRSAAGVLDGLRGGGVFISRDVDGPQLFWSRDPRTAYAHVVDAARAVLLVISSRGVEQATTVPNGDWFGDFDVRDAPLYVRAQLMDANGQMLALSQALPNFG